MTNNKKKLNIKGISLIVLVITIIIIIIIAGAIILSLNNSGIIGKSTLARESNDFVNIRQMVELEKANMLLTGQFNKEKIQIPNIYKDDIEITDTGKIILKNNDDTKITDIQNAIEKLGASYLLDGFDYVETISSREFDSEKLAEYDYRNVAKIIIEGKSEQTTSTQGKNLISSNPEFWDIRQNSSPFQISTDGSIISNDDGELRIITTASVRNAGIIIPAKPDEVYSLSADLKSDSITAYMALRFLTSEFEQITNPYVSRNSRDYGKLKLENQVAPTNTTYVYVRFSSDSPQGFNAKNIQLEFGSTATSYEPFIPNSPSPDYPSSINSVQNFDLISSGKNLFDTQGWYNWLRGFDTTYVEKAVVDNVNSIHYRPNFTYNKRWMENYFKANTQYTLKYRAKGIPGTGTSTGIRISYTDGTHQTLHVPNSSSWHDMLVVSQQNKTIQYISMSYNYSQGIYIDENSIMLVEGIYNNKTIPQYESYNKTSNTFPYTLRSLPDGTKDYIEIDNVNKTAKLIQKVGFIILNGTEAWVTDGNAFYLSSNIYTPNITTPPSPLISNQYKFDGLKYTVSMNNLTICNNQFEYETNQYKILIKNTFYTNTTNFKNYLSQTPVEVKYKLQTPIIYNLTYNEVQAYYPYTQIYTNAAVKPSIGAKVIVN